MVLTTFCVRGAYICMRVAAVTAYRCGRAGEKCTAVTGAYSLTNTGCLNALHCRASGLDAGPGLGACWTTTGAYSIALSVLLSVSERKTGTPRAPDHPASDKISRDRCEATLSLHLSLHPPLLTASPRQNSRHASLRGYPDRRRDVLRRLPHVRTAGVPLSPIGVLTRMHTASSSTTPSTRLTAR